MNHRKRCKRRNQLTDLLDTLEQFIDDFDDDERRKKTKKCNSYFCKKEYNSKYNYSFFVTTTTVIIVIRSYVPSSFRYYSRSWFFSFSYDSRLLLLIVLPLLLSALEVFIIVVVVVATILIITQLLFYSFHCLLFLMGLPIVGFVFIGFVRCVRNHRRRRLHTSSDWDTRTFRDDRPAISNTRQVGRSPSLVGSDDGVRAGSHRTERRCNGTRWGGRKNPVFAGLLLRIESTSPYGKQRRNGGEIGVVDEAVQHKVI